MLEYEPYYIKSTEKINNFEYAEIYLRNIGGITKVPLNQARMLISLLNDAFKNGVEMVFTSTEYSSSNINYKEYIDKWSGSTSANEFKPKQQIVEEVHINAYKKQK